MSTRTYFFSITSIEPIRGAVGANDDSLLEAVMRHHADQLRERYGDDEEVEEDEEIRGYAESMIKCATPPEEEPGCWNYVIELLARHFRLAPDADLPFNEGWKHYHVWALYRAAVAGHVTPESERSLEYLESGRPLKGSRVDHDGSVFGWLTPQEVGELYRSLSQLDGASIADEDLAEFHEALVESLKTIRNRNAALLMAAH